jgi:ABC-type multidrug transport system fused ATPase/permease subunit
MCGRMSCRDVWNIENGIGDKLGTLIQWTATFVAGYIVGFISGWKLTLIMLSIMPIAIVSAAVVGMVTLSRLLSMIACLILVITHDRSLPLCCFSSLTIWCT